MTSLSDEAREKPLSVTVVLPVYNGGKWLLPAVESIRRQTFLDWELLLIDDGSTDDAVQSVRSLSDSRIQIFQDGQNKGLATRLNEGIDMANGRYLARMDADDLVFPDRLAAQVDYLDRHPEVDLLATRIAVFGALPVPRVSASAIDHDGICKNPWRGIAMPHPTWMGRIEWFRKHRYYLPEYVRAEDQELLLRAMPTSRYACLDRVLLAYRQGAFSLFRTFRARRSVLAFQMRHFGMRREWRSLGFAFVSFLAKVGVDVLAALPGGESIFFRRMGQVAPRALDHLDRAGLE